MYKNLDDQFGISKLFADQIQQNFGENANWRSIVEKAIGFVTTGLGGVMGSIFTIVSSIFSTVVNIFISLILSVYMLAEKERLIAGVSKVTKVYVKPAVKNWLDKVVNVVNGCFRSFFVGQCTEAVILGVLCMIGMNIFGFPYATMIGTLIGFTALIPVAGAYIGAGIGAFMVFTAGSWLETLLFIVFILVLQQLEGNLIYPKVVGDSIGLPGIWVLAAVFVCGSAMGIPGMMIGVPITAAVYKLVKQDVKEKEEAREMSESASDNSPVSAEDAEIVSEE
jgi:predicted PurR-regulated permease PerM